MKIKALNVNEVNNYIKRILTNDPILYNLRIKGEISNLKVHSSKNIYLSLKDSSSKINCVIFKDRNINLLEIKEGTSVIASGYISLYERDGSYQFYINTIEIDGLGDLHTQYLKLKEKLKNEGLFESKYKKPIPKIPENIGIITSPTGSVIRDIINVVERRYPKINLKLYPVHVQGEKSKSEIISGIEFFNENKNVDAIIIARGGGSIEELWSFNEEEVAKSIFKSQIPIISAIGHETDYTIADFVSDLRAPTPSAAAEIIVPDIEEVVYKLNRLKIGISKNIENKLVLCTSSLKLIQNKLELNSRHLVKDKFMELDYLYDTINKVVCDNIDNRKSKLEYLGKNIHNLSPLSTLNRGYSLVTQKGIIVKKIDDILIDEELKILVKNGEIDCKVKNLTYNEVE